MTEKEAAKGPLHREKNWPITSGKEGRSDLEKRNREREGRRRRGGGEGEEVSPTHELALSSAFHSLAKDKAVR